MLGGEDKGRLADHGRRTYLRSVSWTERSPRKSNTKTQFSSKARACFLPLPSLSVTRNSVDEWPKPGSDDLGVWPNPQTPRGVGKPPETCSSEQPVKEFQFKKDKLAFFDKECSRIADHIYLGSDAVAKNRDVLKQNGITHVLNCVGFVCAEYFKVDFVYKTLWLQDSPSEDITSILYDVFDYFEDVREQGGRVFVHCCQGVSRSTSLVIAYLMWREGQSFEDAFQFVKAARGVTNPNLGFASQLLQCQKRVHAAPASPKSLLRMYRMAPHSPYDPLHLVPKLLDNPSAHGLDCRGAFIVHVPAAIYVWIGKSCGLVMCNTARAAASQIVRYERAKEPVVCIREDEEPPGFWEAFSIGNAIDGCDEVELKKIVKENLPSVDAAAIERIVAEYDLDFEIFHKALAGGVVPPFSVLNTELETCLPARENGWSRLRRKLADGFMRELTTSSKLNCDQSQLNQGSGMVMDAECPPLFTTPSPLASSGGSSGLDDCYSNGNLNTVKDVFREDEGQNAFTDPFPSPRPRCFSPDTKNYVSYVDPSSPSMQPDLANCFGCSSPTSISACKEDHLQEHNFSTDPYISSDSFFCFPGSSPHLNSVSPTLSPSLSDYSGSFFSPSSSNWSDFSSRQPSPSSFESVDQNSAKNKLGVDNSWLPYKETPYSPTDTFSAHIPLRTPPISLPCKGIFPSIAERRGGNPPPQMLLSMVNGPSLPTRDYTRPLLSSVPDLDDDVMKDAGCDQFDHEDDGEAQC